MRLIIAISMLAFCSTNQAATLYRCTESSGRIIFSQYGCAPDQAEQLQQANNPPPSGKASNAPKAPIYPSQRSKNQNKPELTVVGEQQDGCGNKVTGNERRRAIIEGRIKSGMTRADVESTLGRPDSTSQQNEKLRYQYKADARRGARTVVFDENGCVISKKKP